MELPPFVEQTEPESVFTLLSDDNRIDILRTLWRGDGPMTFSELHDAVGIRDSGQFNYHLDKLVGQFVTRTEEGYELTTAGQQINGAIEAGSYTTHGSLEPIALDRPCPACGGKRTFSYEDEAAQVSCESCEVTARFSIPPSSFVGCDHEEIPDVAGEYLRVLLDSLDNGFCSHCNGPVERVVCPIDETSMWELAAEGESDELGELRDFPLVQYECLQCGIEPTSGLVMALLSHPEVVGFYYDHGIDVRERSLWEFSTFGPEHEQIHSRDPFRASVTFTLDDDELTLVVDETLDVVDVE